MTDFVIDTNVAVVANRQNANIVDGCVEACIQFLAAVRSGHVILVDSGDEIRREYAGALQMRRPYELGAQFLIHVLQHQFDPKKVRRIDLAKTPEGEFVDFPVAQALVGFDASDRKFAALARHTGEPVTTAVDSDWADYHDALVQNGVQVNFLCGSDKLAWCILPDD